MTRRHGKDKISVKRIHTFTKTLKTKQLNEMNKYRDDIVEKINNIGTVLITIENLSRGFK